MRTEHDSMGEMPVPDSALYGASTQRAVLNFPISGLTLPGAFIRGLAQVKSACAAANTRLKRLDPDKGRLIQRIAQEIVSGGLQTQFPIDVFQTGSGTSTNMNLNEVIANRASQLAGRLLGSRNPLHPNDDVNLGSRPTTSCRQRCTSAWHWLSDSSSTRRSATCEPNWRTDPSPSDRW